jgi:hypothetical protein
LSSNDTDQLAKEYLELDEEIKKLTKRKEELRESFLDNSKKYWENNEHERPITHIHFPASFGGSKDDIEKHLEKNFATWEITDLFEEDGGFSAFLKKKPEFISSRFEGKYVVSKTSSKVTPVINWDTLEKEDSELANGIRDTEISYKLNDKKLNKWIDENPDTMAKLNRHITEGKPTQRIVVSRADDGEPDTE